MENFLSGIQNNPFVILIIAVLALAIALLLIFPATFSYLKSFKIPLSIQKPAKGKEAEEETPNAKKEKTTQKLKFSFNIKSPKTALIGGVLVAALLLAGYFGYDFFFRPVRVVNAWQLKLEQGGKLNQLQKKGLAAWIDAKIYLLDVRSRESYAGDHVIGSGSLPASRASVEFYPIDGITIVVYSGKFNTEDARNVADAIVKNGKSGKVKIKDPGKIYVVKDGFEGLKASGLKTEGGVWD